MENPNILVKALLLGMQGVGKNQILNRWVHNKFTSTHQKTIGADFAVTEVTAGAKKITLQLWHTPDDRDGIYHTLLVCRNADVFFIIVAADKLKEENISQIQTWLNWIEQNKLANDKTKIVIIENKTDVENAILLSEDDLQQFKDKYAYFQTYSAKDSNREPLDNILRSILPQLSPELAPAQNDNSQLLSKARPTYHSTKTNINALTEPQAIILLKSLRVLLDHGPVNEREKSYDMKFGGGRLLKQIGETKVKAPEHVIDWIHQTIDIALATEDSSKANALSSLYDSFIIASLNKPFSRSASTHDFYKNCLPGFIEHCVTTFLDPKKGYFLIRDNIDKLSGLDALNALNTIIYKLKLGPLNNTVSPYNVTFFGGKKVIVDYNQVSIQAPGHVASLLNYLMYDPNASAAEKVIYALDFSIASKFSTCGSREQSTQDFYNELPTFIANTVAKKAEKSPESSVAASPYRTL